MKAIILAAGDGSRFSSSSGERKPKCLMEVGQTTLLNIQIDRLYDCGVDEIVIVRGYEKAQIDVPGIRYYDNDEYQTTNVLYSLLAAEQELVDDVLVLYSDIYYEDSSVKLLLQSRHDITLGALVNHENIRRLKSEAMLEQIELIDFTPENSIERIGKHLPPESDGTRGQFIGIFKMTRRGCQSFRNFLSLYRNKLDASGRPCYRHDYLTDLFSAMIDCGINIHTTIVESGWFEVNTPEDYQQLLQIQAVKDKYLVTRTDWTARSAKYDRLEWVNNDELLRQLASCITDLGPDSRVLDIGTGTGKVLIYLKLKKGDARYFGIDTSAAMMRKIDPAYGFDLREACVTNLDCYPDDYFDYVTARMVLHHVGELDEAMREIRRKLKKGGKLIVCEGNPPSYAAYNFYMEMFFYKEIRNVFMESDLVNLYVRNGYGNVTTKTVMLNAMSLNNWIDNSGLPQRNIDIVKRMHHECGEAVRRDYNMVSRGDDILMDWKFSILVGEK